MNTLPSPIRSGFTLIEMMLSVALGSLIVYTATAGFRTAAQSVTIANRMSLENSLIRAGFQAALNETDYWTSYDDPDNASDQALRSTTFRELSSVMGNLGVGANPTPYPGAETTIGWDPHYEWPAADRRTWWRGNAAEYRATDLRMGSYAIFADKSDTGNHPWLYAQMDGLHRALGYYGFCDYLPPSQLYSLVDSSDGSKNAGGTPSLWVQAGGRFRTGDGGTHYPQGRYRCTKDASFALTPIYPVNLVGDPTPGHNKVAVNLTATGDLWSNFRTGIGSTVSGTTGFMSKVTGWNYRLYPQKPDHWPGLGTYVARYMTYNRFVCLHRIRWVNALTGELSELSFNAFGTTLRGARQQRRKGGGWADWSNPLTPPTNHLDSP